MFRFFEFDVFAFRVLGCGNCVDIRPKFSCNWWFLGFLCLGCVFGFWIDLCFDFVSVSVGLGLVSLVVFEFEFVWFY